MRERAKTLLHTCRGYLFTLAGSLLFLGAFLLLRGNRGLMNFLIQYVTTPWKRGASFLICLFPVSAMEICIALVVVLALFLIIRCILRLKKDGLKVLCRTLLFFCCAVLLVYDGFCLFWGINYYGDSFSDKSGLMAEAVSAEELYAAASYYADIANETCSQVKRNGDGHFDESLDDIFAGAEQVYDQAAARWSFLETPWRRPKRVFFSKIMSEMNFTGVFFPFLGESNLNVDSPACLIPSTIAHELAHQKNIAAEQEANFVAVIASVSSDNVVYRYSGALLAYIYLGNALYQADRDLWAEVYSSLNPLVIGDLDQNNAYWASFEGPPAKAAEAVYTGFLQSYGQTLGMQSYGACVDLLVAEYLSRF